MKRKRYMLNRIPKAADRRKRGTELIASLLKMLRDGWSPWVENQETRGYVPIEEALEKYEKSLEKLLKNKTRYSYGSRLNLLREFINQLVVPPRYVYQYNTAFVSEFLDWLYLDREVGGRTRNNYRSWCSSLASFFIERGYISENPVDKIKKVPETPKKRLPLSAAMLKQLREHLAEKNPMFLLACMMEYYTMIRPEELVNLRINDISVAEQSVFVSCLISKNKRDGKVSLPL